jgi:HAD superfamily hydrolase (TIGR01450 family)
MLAGELPPEVAGRLRAARGFVLDLDGTLVLGDARNHQLAPLPGALGLTRWLTSRDVPFAVLTNGTTRTPAGLARTLRDIGFGLPDDAVLTPASSAAALFRRAGYRRVLTLGHDGLAGPLREAGIEPVPPVPAGRPAVDAVLAGWYPEFTMPALEAACHAVWAGAALYSCSQSMFFATADGRALGTSRAISVMIQSMTGCRLHLVGKPSLHAFRCAAGRLGVPGPHVVVVGDDPELEVPMAHRGRALAVAVGTGIGAPGAFDHLPPARRPHLTLPGVADLLTLCQQLDG